jgi:hypothetical protein
MPDLTFLPIIVVVTLIAYVLFATLMLYLYGKQENFRSTGQWNFESSAVLNYFEVLPFHFTYSSIHFQSGVYVLLFTRLLSLCFFLGIACLWSFSSDQWTSLFYFTSWNVCLISVYFSLASLSSIFGVCYGLQNNEFSEGAVPWSSNVNRLGFVVQIMYEVAGASAFFITVVAFSLLNPQFEFWNVAHHFLTSISFLIEVAQNTMVVRWHHVLLCMLWAVCYLIYIWPAVAMGDVTNWPYDFLKVGSATSFVWYFVLFFVNGLFYAGWYGLSRAKYEVLFKDFGSVQALLPFHLRATASLSSAACSPQQNQQLESIEISSQRSPVV